MRLFLGSVVLVLGVSCGLFPCDAEPAIAVIHTVCRASTEPSIEVGVPFELTVLPGTYSPCTVTQRLDAGIIELGIVTSSGSAQCGFNPGGAARRPALPVPCQVPGLPAGTYQLVADGRSTPVTVPSNSADAGALICP